MSSVTGHRPNFALVGPKEIYISPLEKMINAITSWPIPAESMLMLELSKWLPDERMHLFKAHLPSSLISADILLRNPLNPIPDKWVWQVNKHPTSPLLKYYAPVTGMLPCIHFHTTPLLFKNVFLMMEWEKLLWKPVLPWAQCFNPCAQMHLKKSLPAMGQACHVCFFSKEALTLP